jgi:SAM-dependent methyltransferase
LVFGEVADDYDEYRAGYPAAVVDAMVTYLGRTPEAIVEVGAGTGLATEALAAIGAPITCVEPDASMAAILARKFPAGSTPPVDVVNAGFEDFTPARRVDLVVSAQAWHWVSPADRLRLAHEALVPGGVLALTGHQYGFADPEMLPALTVAYQRYAPHLVHGSAAQSGSDWKVSEMVGSPLFTDTTNRVFSSDVDYPTERYLRLLTTFSAHRMLPPDQCQALLDAIAAIVDEHGGVVVQRLSTVLALGRAV